MSTQKYDARSASGPSANRRRDGETKKPAGNMASRAANAIKKSDMKSRSQCQRFALGRIQNKMEGVNSKRAARVHYRREMLSVIGDGYALAKKAFYREISSS